MNETLSVAIPCRVDEPDLGTTLASLAVACRSVLLPTGLVTELVVCINGVEKRTVSEPLKAVYNFCHRHDVALEEVWMETGDTPHPVPLPFGARGPVGGVEEAKSKTVGNYWQEEQCHSEPKRRAGEESRKTGSYEKDSSASGLRMTNPQMIANEMGFPPFSRCTVLLTERRGKPPAWNLLWQWATSELVLFADADVQVDAEAVYHLWARFQQEPGLRLVAAREVPVLKDGGTLWSRMGAIPYRFNFGNAGGRLLLLRKQALPNGMPEDLLLEDAWLTVAVGRDRVAKEMQAQVFFLPPATGRDYFAERVRTEGGKLQIRRLHKELLAAGPIAQYHWSQFWRELRLTEYPLVIFALVVRWLARLWARLSLTRKDFYALYRPFTSTKKWESRSP